LSLLGFYINLPIGAVVGLLLILLDIPESTPKPPVMEVFGTAINSLDLPGFALIAPAAIMFFLALQWGGNQHAWNSSIVIGLFCGAAAVFALFLLWEHHRGDEAMVPFAMLKKRIIWSASTTMFFFMGVLFLGNFYLPIYFQAVKDDSALMSGVHLLPTILSQVLFAMTSGVLGKSDPFSANPLPGFSRMYFELQLTSRTNIVQSLGYYLPWVLSGTALTTIAYGLLSLVGPATAVHSWIGYQILFGIGCGAAATGVSFPLPSY